MSEIENYDAKGYYQALELDSDASHDDIKQNYRNIAKIWHPDQNDSEEALEKFQKISVAYDILKDNKKKIVYDLLCQVYNAENFPDMFSLKSYKDREGREDVFVRNIKQKKIIGKIIKASEKNEVEICSFDDAKKMVVKVSFLNWLLGWWSVQGFVANIGAIVGNINEIDKNTKDNLRLLIHNTIAYWQENKNDKAMLSLIQATDYADQRQKKLLSSFAAIIGGKVQKKVSPWNFGVLKLLQMIFPATIGVFLLLPLLGSFINLEALQKDREKNKEVRYYQEVKFSVTGGRTFDDVVVAKILDIPVDTKDPDLLYHVSSKTNVMHAPGDDFDVLTKIDANTTVRVTGYSPDKVWFRVMLDGGEMGFVRRAVLKKGIGKEIPVGSKIYEKPF